MHRNHLTPPPPSPLTTTTTIPGPGIDCGILRDVSPTTAHKYVAQICHGVTESVTLVPLLLEFACGLTYPTPFWVSVMPQWKPFGLNNVLPRRFPRQRRGNKRQPIIPLKEWKIVRGDTVRRALECQHVHAQNEKIIPASLLAWW